MKKIAAVLVLGIIGLAGFSQSVNKDYVDGKIYVRMKPQNNPVLKKGLNLYHIPSGEIPALENLASAYGIKNLAKPFYQAKNWDELQRTFSIEFYNANDVEKLIEDLEKSGLVDFAEKVPLMKNSYTPNDPSYGSQWHLPQINAPAAWNIFSGNSNITVAVVDNAVQTNHTDLSANIWVNPGETAGNGIDDDNNGYIDDINGYDVSDLDNNPMPPNTTFAHGTHCAGIIGARTDNNTGISAIGFNIKIIAVKATMNSGTQSSIDAGYGGIVYAVNAKARVISCSWGGAGSSTTEQSVINYAWANNSMVVAAAGNDNNNILHYPGAYNNVYCVASTTTGDVRSSFSCYGTWVDIAAPGSNIYSTVPTNGYTNMSGTSMATPLVAGLCGLVIAYKPYMTMSQVISCINTTAANINSQNPGFNGQLGAGRIDANGALTCATGLAPAGPTVNFIAAPTLTCPGSPVKFYDKSFVGLTSWAWTFQGGTPATSTLQNPTITYAAAGTYSVQLIGTNPNGNATKIKTSYITVSGPTALPLMEGFTAATYPPAGWSEYDALLDSMKWYRNTSVGGFSATGQCMWFDNYSINAVGKRDRIQTPKYNMISYSSASLTFDVAYRQYDATYSDTLAVLVSTDCGQTFNQVYLKGGNTLGTATSFSTALFVPTATQWRTETVSLSGYTGQGSVLVAFENRGRYGQAIYVDNINITGVLSGAPPTANFTTSTTKCTGQAINFTDATTGAPTSWAWTFTGGSPATSTNQNPTVTYAVGGVYTVTLVATNANGNSTSTQTFTVTNIPTASAGLNKVITCLSPVVQLNGSGGGSYAWSGPSGYTSALIQPNVFNPGTYTLVVTSSGCVSPQATVSVTSNTVQPNASAATTSTLTCAVLTGTVNASSSTSGATFVWSGTGIVSGGATAAATVNAPGVYTATVTNPANGCVKTATVSVTSNTVAPAIPTVTQLGNVLTSSSATNNQWYFNGSIMPGEINQNLTVTQNGNYTVQVTDPINSCVSNSTVFVVGSIGINTASINSSLNVFPNPSNGEFTVTFTLNEKTNLKLAIRNVLGQIVYEEELNNAVGQINKNVNLNFYGKGQYYITLTNSTDVIIKKIITQ